MKINEIIIESKQFPTQDYEGLKISMVEKDGQLIVKAIDDWGVNELGYVIFNIGDNDELDPQDLEVDDRYRGQGIAKVMYDFVSSHGYEIHRSHDQTDDGAGFWNKHRGGDVRVWEDEELNELRGIKNDFKQPISARDYLTQHGFKQIGFGGYASVWEHPNLDYVLKTFSPSDKAYLAWVSICTQHRGNPYLPKFVSTKPIKLPTGNYAIRMERLQRGTDATVDLANEIQKFIVLTALQGRNKSFNTKWEMKKAIDYEWEKLQSYANDTNFLDAVWLIYQAVLSSYGHPDIIPNNIMMRDNTIVFTDPLSP